MPRWLSKTLERIKDLATSQKVAFTLKALGESAELGLDEEDACDVLARLRAEDCAERRRSSTGEWMYVFKPQVAGVVVYIKLLLRTNCVLISFHKDEAEDHEED
jgi:hypothetical protein